MRQRFRSHDTDEIFFPLSRAGVAWEYIWDIGCSCCCDGGIEPGTQVDHVVLEPVQADHGAFVLGGAILELLQPAERLDPAHHRLFPFRCFSATNSLVLSCLSASIASVATGQSSSHPLSHIPSLLSRCGRIGDASVLIGSRWGGGGDTCRSVRTNPARATEGGACDPYHGRDWAAQTHGPAGGVSGEIGSGDWPALALDAPDRIGANTPLDCMDGEEAAWLGLLAGRLSATLSRHSSCSQFQAAFRCDGISAV